jgi:hypothetical protein
MLKWLRFLSIGRKQLKTVLAGKEQAIGDYRDMLWIIPEVWNARIIIKRNSTLGWQVYFDSLF